MRLDLDRRADAALGSRRVGRGPARSSPTPRPSLALGCCARSIRLRPATDHEAIAAPRPLRKMLCGRLPESDPDLGSQSTLSRFENACSARYSYRLAEGWGKSICVSGCTRCRTARVGLIHHDRSTAHRISRLPRLLPAAHVSPPMVFDADGQIITAVLRPHAHAVRRCHPRRWRGTARAVPSTARWPLRPWSTPTAHPYTIGCRMPAGAARGADSLWRYGIVGAMAAKLRAAGPCQVVSSAQLAVIIAGCRITPAFSPLTRHPLRLTPSRTLHLLAVRIALLIASSSAPAAAPVLPPHTLPALPPCGDGAPDAFTNWVRRFRRDPRSPAPRLQPPRRAALASSPHAPLCNPLILLAQCWRGGHDCRGNQGRGKRETKHC